MLEFLKESVEISFAFLVEALIRHKISRAGSFDCGNYFYSRQMAFLPEGWENSISFN